MKHHATQRFWRCYRQLPKSVRQLADKQYALLKENPSHPSLHFKRIARFYSVRVGLAHRALGVAVEDGVLWFWVGTHAEYEKIAGY